MDCDEWLDKHYITSDSLKIGEFNGSCYVTGLSNMEYIFDTVHGHEIDEIKKEAYLEYETLSEEERVAYFKMDSLPRSPIQDEEVDGLMSTPPQILIGIDRGFGDYQMYVRKDIDEEHNFEIGEQDTSTVMMADEYFHYLRNESSYNRWITRDAAEFFPEYFDLAEGELSLNDDDKKHALSLMESEITYAGLGCHHRLTEHSLGVDEAEAYLKKRMAEEMNNHLLKENPVSPQISNISSPRF